MLDKAQKEGKGFIVIGKDTIVNEVVKLNINRYRDRIKYLEKKTKQLEAQPPPPTEKVDGFYISSPVLYPKNAKRKKNLFYKKNQIKKVSFDYGLKPFSEDSTKKSVDVEIRFGIPLGNGEHKWIKETKNIPFGNSKSMEFDVEKHIGKKKNKGVYYLWAYEPGAPDNKPLCKLEFAVE